MTIKTYLETLVSNERERLILKDALTNQIAKEKLMIIYAKINALPYTWSPFKNTIQTYLIELENFSGPYFIISSSGINGKTIFFTALQNLIKTINISPSEIDQQLERESKEDIEIILLEENDCLHNLQIPKNKIFIQTTRCLPGKLRLGRKKNNIRKPVEPIYITFDHKFSPPYERPNMGDVTEELRTCLI
jgi:hypothetical protein